MSTNDVEKKLPVFKGKFQEAGPRSSKRVWPFEQLAHRLSVGDEVICNCSDDALMGDDLEVGRVYKVSALGSHTKYDRGYIYLEGLPLRQLGEWRFELRQPSLNWRE